MRALWLVCAFAFLGLGACGADSQAPSGGEFGPLAVLEGGGGDDASGGTAPVQFGEKCVTMTLFNGHVVIPVWHRDQVRWDEEQRAIIFAANEDPPITIREGDIIAIGGSSLVPDDSALVTDRVWAAEPDPSCVGELFGTSSIRKH